MARRRVGRLFEFQGQRFWAGYLWCSCGGGHEFKATLPLKVALSYIGYSSKCEAHGGAWLERTARGFDHVVKIHRDEYGRMSAERIFINGL